MRNTCHSRRVLNLSCVFKDIHPNFLAYKCGKIFFIKPSLKIFVFVESFLFLFFTGVYRFVLISACLLYLYNQQISLRLLVWLLLWAKGTFLEVRIRCALWTHSCIHLRVILFWLSFIFGFEKGLFFFYIPFCPVHSLFLFFLQFLRSAVMICQELAWIPLSSPKRWPNLSIK